MERSNNLQLKKIVEKLKPYEPERIVLFGSHARGEADEFSDLDLVIIKDTIVEHSVYRLCQASAAHDPSFAQLVGKLGALDRFYIPTRYPNGLPLGGVPAQTYGSDDAQTALILARQAIEAVEVHFAAPNPGSSDHEQTGDDSQ